jgi:membrane fusion protein (multidrug efflux system)
MKSIWFRRILLVAVGILLLAAIFPAVKYYRYFNSHVSTDDAYVDGSVGLISSRITGTVVKVFVEDNWRVRAGDTLLELDQNDYQVQVNAAEAQLERARQTVDQLYAQVEAARSGFTLAESQLSQARIDYNRARQLKAQGVVSSEYYDQATTALRVGLATEGLAKHQLMQAEAALGTNGEDHSRYDRPVVQQAEAALEAAKLYLSYTDIKAPFDGIVTRKNVHVGHRVEAGQPLMALVPIRGLYITANYKETQLTRVRVGQPTEIEADIYPGYIYRAHVDSISIGTGSAFALLPPENATGNWVKVVQRVPVKIVLDQPEPPDKPLRMGLSVEVTIDISDTRGPLLTSTLQREYREHGAIPETLRRVHPLEPGLQQYHVIPPSEHGPAPSQSNPAQQDPSRPNPTEPSSPPAGASSQ